MSILSPHRSAAAVAVLALALAVPAAARADDPVTPECPSADVSSLAAVECSGVDPVPSLDPADTDAAIAVAAARSAAEAVLPHQCRLHSEAVFYTSSDWVRFTRILSENTSYCADFYLSVPPLVADKRNPRPGAAAAIKAFGPQFHPMAEIHYATWAKYIGTPETPTWYDAGLAAGSTYQAFGYDAWAVNEASSAVAR